MKVKYKLDDHALCEKFNRFLESVEDKFQFNFLGYCNGLSSLFLIYAMHGKLGAWRKEFITIARSGKDAFQSYPYQILAYKVMLNILRMQRGFVSADGKGIRQLNLQSAEIITAIDFVEIKNLSDYDEWADTTLEHFFLQQSETILIRLYSHLETVLDEYIEINWDVSRLGYRVVADKEYFFESHSSVLEFIKENAPVYFKCAPQSRLIAALHEKKELAVRLEEAAYLLLDDNKTFSIESILDFIEPDTGVLLASKSHTIALYKISKDSWFVYNNGNGVPIKLTAAQIEYNVERDMDLAGHVNISLFRRPDQKPLQKKLAPSIFHTLNYHREYVIGKYKNPVHASSSQTDSNDEDFLNQDLETLVFFCIDNDFEPVLHWYLQQFNADLLVEIQQFLPELAEAGYSQVIKFLVSNNVDIHATNDNQEDGLYLAYLNNHMDIVSLLLQNGCFLNKNDHNENVCSLALARKDSAMLLRLFNLCMEKKLCMELGNEYIADVFLFATDNQIQPLVQMIELVKNERLSIIQTNSLFKTDKLDENKYCPMNLTKD